MEKLARKDFAALVESTPKPEPELPSPSRSGSLIRLTHNQSFYSFFFPEIHFPLIPSSTSMASESQESVTGVVIAYGA